MRGRVWARPPPLVPPRTPVTDAPRSTRHLLCSAPCLAYGSPRRAPVPPEAQPTARPAGLAGSLPVPAASAPRLRSHDGAGGPAAVIPRRARPTGRVPPDSFGTVLMSENYPSCERAQTANGLSHRN